MATPKIVISKNPFSKYGWLSPNDYRPFEFDGKIWPTVTHLILAYKYKDQILEEDIRESKTWMVAKIKSMPRKIQDQTEPHLGVDVLYKIAKKKFEEYPYLLSNLLNISGINLTYPDLPEWGEALEKIRQDGNKTKTSVFDVPIVEINVPDKFIQHSLKVLGKNPSKKMGEIAGKEVLKNILSWTEKITQDWSGVAKSYEKIVNSISLKYGFQDSVIIASFIRWMYIENPKVSIEYKPLKPSKNISYKIGGVTIKHTNGSIKILTQDEEIKKELVLLGATDNSQNLECDVKVCQAVENFLFIKENPKKRFMLAKTIWVKKVLKDCIGMMVNDMSFDFLITSVLGIETIDSSVDMKIMDIVKTYLPESPYTIAFSGLLGSNKNYDELKSYLKSEPQPKLDTAINKLLPGVSSDIELKTKIDKILSRVKDEELGLVICCPPYLRSKLIGLQPLEGDKLSVFIRHHWVDYYQNLALRLSK